MENNPTTPDNNPAPQEVRLGIPPPPDYIFKYRKNRQAPAQEVWGGGTVTFIPERAEYIEGKGNFVYYYGVPFPSKTVAPVEAIHAMSGIKRLTINALKFFSQLHKKGRLTRLFFYFNDIGQMMVHPFCLNDGYYCALVKEIRIFIETFLTSTGVEKEVAQKTGEFIGMMFEYDNAYRFRVQDLCTETTIEALVENLPKELERLIEIQRTRENEPVGGQQVVERFKSALTPLRYAWKIPYLRNRFRKALNAINLKNCQLDEADIYHTLLYGDYSVRGKSLEERFKIIEEIHGPDRNNWPKQIIIRSNTA